MQKPALIIVTLAVCLALPAAGAWLLLAPEAGAAAPPAATQSSLQQLKQRLSANQHSPQQRQLRLSQSDSNQLMQQLLRSMKWPVSSGITLGSQQGTMNISLDTGLPLRPFLNLELNFRNSGQYLVWSSAKAGQVRLAPAFVNWLHGIITPALLRRIDSRATDFWQLPDQVSVREGELLISFNTAREQDQLALLFGTETLNRLPFYQHQLATVFANHQGRLSLATAMAALFHIAATEKEQDPLIDNRAIILSLFLHTSDHRNLQLIDWPRSLVPAAPLQLTLHRRQDLAEHWLATASISLLANRQIAKAIGTYKELLDGQQKKGMDVTDLVANQAGSLLAELLIQGSNSKSQQLRLARVQSDSELLPLNRELKHTLEQQVASGHYQMETLYQQIELHLMNTALYQQL